MGPRHATTSSARRWTLIAVAAGAALAGGVIIARARRRATTPLLEGDLAQPMPSGVVDSAVSAPTETDLDGDDGRRGTPDDRGRMPAYALDVERIRARDGMEPVVQYLTFIQSQRGDDSSLLFVRYEDIDAMAALEGTETGDFLERLDQLGVVVSNN